MEQYLLKDYNQPDEFIRSLVHEFDTDSFDVFTEIEPDETISAHLTSQNQFGGGSRTSIYVYVRKQKDDLLITVSEQEWSSIASSLGKTIFSTVINPINLLHRLDDIAVDVQNLQLGDRVARFVKTFKQKKDELVSTETERYTCGYCKSRNPAKSTHCVACGAPL